MKYAFGLVALATPLRHFGVRGVPKEPKCSLNWLVHSSALYGYAGMVIAIVLLSFERNPLLDFTTQPEAESFVLYCDHCISQ